MDWNGQPKFDPFAKSNGEMKSISLFIAAMMLSQSASADECRVDYAIAGQLLIRDTQFGAANGVYPLAGNGIMHLSFDNDRQTVKLLSYSFHSSFTVKAKVAFFSTEVLTDSTTTVNHGCEGTFVDHQVKWITPIDNYLSDGTLTCIGNMCGKFGAPPLGQSPLHETARIVFQPFLFDSDNKTFSMGYAQVSHSSSPSQTTYLTLSGREVKRTCSQQR